MTPATISPLVLRSIPLILLLAACGVPAPTPTHIAPTSGRVESTPTELPTPTPSAALAPPCQPSLVPSETENRWISIGPYGGSIRAIVADPADPDSLFVATYGAGVYHSDNGGEIWTLASNGLSNPNITTLVADPVQPGTLYAGTSCPDCAGGAGALFRSVDAARTWQILYEGGGAISNAVASLVTGHGRLYVGSTAVMTVQNGSARRISDIDMGAGDIRVALDPIDEQTVYAGTDKGGLYLTYDLGATWSRILLTAQVLSIAVDPSDPALILVGAAEGLLRSTDRGVTWSRVLGDPARSILFDPREPGRVWAGAEGGLWTSTDDGQTWRTTPAFSGIRVESLALVPDRPELLFVGTYRNGLFRSRDKGETWQPVNSGIANVFVNAIAPDPTSPTRLYVGTLGDGLFMTADLGLTWTQPTSELSGADVQAIAVDPTDPDTVFVGAWPGLFASRDAGRTWASVGALLEDKQVVSLAVSPDGTGTVFAGTYGDGLFASSDAGATWVRHEGPHPYVTALLLDPTAPTSLYAGTLNGVYRTPDAGTTWERISTGLRDLNVRALAPDSVSGSLLAATGDGIYLSRNRGLSWERLTDNLGSDYFRGVAGGDPVFATTSHGVFASDPANYRWTSVPVGTLNQRINTLARAGQVLFAGAYGGGVYALHMTCWPIYGLVTHAATGQPVYAQVTLDPGSYTTYTDIDGRYSFENLPPGSYRVTAATPDSLGVTSVSVDISTASDGRVDILIPAGVQMPSFPIAILGPPLGATLFSGQPLTLVASASLREGPLTEFRVQWDSDLGGPLGFSPFDGSGMSRIEVRLYTPGIHTISATIIRGSEDVGHTTTRLEVREPTNLHAIGMAWDGRFLWVTEERPEMGQVGRIYQMSTDGGHLAIVNTYPHPSPAPDSIAWNGEAFWTSGTEGPDPYRPWEEGMAYLYRHTLDGGLSVSHRYADVCAAGLTWDGTHLWESHRGDFIARLDIVDDQVILEERYPSPENQIRTIEWVNGFMWAFDAADHRLSKLNPHTGAVLGSCIVDSDSYAIAWDGVGFWILMNGPGNGELRRFVPGPDCPTP